VLAVLYNTHEERPRVSKKYIGTLLIALGLLVMGGGVETVKYNVIYVCLIQDPIVI